MDRLPNLYDVNPAFHSPQLRLASPNKLRNVLISVGALRLIHERTGFKGRRISRYLEQLVLSDLDPQHADRQYAQSRSTTHPHTARS